MNPKDRIYTYLNQNSWMALATADTNGKPEVATVEYVMDGDSLLLMTYTYYRKYDNLIQNPVVACVITTAHEKTLQFDADIVQLKSKEAEAARRKMLNKEPGYKDYFTDSSRFFRITPHWMRLKVYSGIRVEEFEYSPRKSEDQN